MKVVFTKLLKNMHLVLVLLLLSADVEGFRICSMKNFLPEICSKPLVPFCPYRFSNHAWQSAAIEGGGTGNRNEQNQHQELRTNNIFVQPFCQLLVNFENRVKI